MRSRIITLCAVAVVMGAPLTAPAQATTNTRTKFDVVNLVSDVRGKAAVTDPKLVNPWGLAMGKTLWVSNAGTGSATVYSGEGRKQQTEVWIPGGAPTGQVVNPGDGFTVKGKPATFIFASPSGAITGWNAEVDPKNAIIGAFTRGADYKGLALAETDDGDFLLAADFAGGRIDAFDEDFKRVRLSRSAFRDRTVPRPTRRSTWRSSTAASASPTPCATPRPASPWPAAARASSAATTWTGRLTGRISRLGLNAPWAIVKAPEGLGAVRRTRCSSATSATAPSTPTAQPPPRRAARQQRQDDRAARPVGPGARHRGQRRRELPVVLRRHRRRQARPAGRDRPRAGRFEGLVAVDHVRPRTSPTHQTHQVQAQSPYGGY